MLIKIINNLYVGFWASQIPLFVATKMSRFKRTSLFIPSAETYSRASLRFIGYEHLCVPYWPHSVQCSILSALPDTLKDQWLLQYFLGMRKRTLLKDSQNMNQKTTNPWVGSLTQCSFIIFKTKKKGSLFYQVELKKLILRA